MPAPSSGPRFVARQHTAGRSTSWGVYDTLTYSWPVHLNGFTVRENLPSQAAAQAEADRLAAYLDEEP